MYWLDALLYGSAAIVVLCTIAVMFRPRPRKAQRREYEMRNSSMSDIASGGMLEGSNISSECWKDQEDNKTK